MPDISGLSILTPGLAFVLALVYVSLQPSHPERRPLPGQRMNRIAVKLAIDFVAMAIVILRLFVSSGEWLGPTAAAEGSIAPVGWGRAGIAAGSLWAVSVDATLIAIALAAVATQYIARRTFSRRSLGLNLDGVGRATGRPERAVYALGTVVIAGVGEEVVFRALLPAIFFAATSSTAVAILVPLVLFTVLHYDQGRMGLVNAALIGAAATILFLVTEQLWWSIALHAFANLVATVVSPEIRRARVRRIARRAVQGQFANGT